LAICFSLANENSEQELFMPYQSVNPATGEVLRIFEEHTDQQMMGRDLEFKGAGVYITGWAKTQNGNSGLRPSQGLNRIGGTKRQQ
jgi:hypothetical protein